MAVTRAWKVYGNRGHSQRESYYPSYRWNFSEQNETRVIECRNFDKTNTHDYSIVIITRDTAEECYREMKGQITDGIFENCKVGNYVECTDSIELEV